MYGDSTSGQNALYRVGMTGIPVINVNNNCSTGSSALFLARQAVASGAADCVLALGFEQMRRGALKAVWDDRPSAFTRFDEAAARAQGAQPDVPGGAQVLRRRGRGLLRQKYGMDPAVFAQVSVKSRRHAAANPYAVFTAPVTAEEVLASPRIFGPLTRLQCCPPTCGAAAAVVVSEEFARARGLRTGVAIAAQAMTTDTPASFDGDLMRLVGYDMTAAAARQVYESAGVDPRDIRVVELHDCFTTNEVISYEALGLTAEGTAEKFIADGDNTYGGRVVTNPSGGLLSKGHPLGATGLAQCAELVWQLRGEAGAAPGRGRLGGPAAQHRPGRRRRGHPVREGVLSMAIDEDKARAYRFEPIVVTVERGRLALFARVTGQADPVYTDLAAARAAGHPDLPVPPTFFFGLELEMPAPFGYLAELGIDLRQVLHGRQTFRYHALPTRGHAHPDLPHPTWTSARPALEFLVSRPTSFAQRRMPLTMAYLGCGSGHRAGADRRADLAGHAGPVRGSGDHNPIHIDLDVARSAGLDDVFAHGMLSMAYRRPGRLGPQAAAVLAGPLQPSRATASPPAPATHVTDGLATVKLAST